MVAQNTALSGSSLSAQARPLFSVVIPMYNAERFIGETLESVQAQSVEDFEVLVVDDCSTDQSAAIAARFATFDSRIKLHRLEQHCGCPAVPRNLGFKMSRGEFVAFLDADDLWAPEKLANDLQFLRSSQVDIVHSGSWYFATTRANVVHRIVPKRLTSRFFVKNCVSMLTVCVRRASFENQVLFDPDPLLGIEDYHFLLNAFRRGVSIAARPGLDAYHRVDVAGSYYAQADFSKVFSRHIYNVTKLSAEWRLPPSKICLWLLATAGFHLARRIRDVTVHFFSHSH